MYIDHSHHLVTRSTSFLVDYLQTVGDVSLEFEDCWRTGAEPKNYLNMIGGYDLVVVFQMPQVIFQLCSAGHPNVVFIPMYDTVASWKEERWLRLGDVRMISFSATVHAICNSYGLDSYPIQYYPQQWRRTPAGYGDLRLFFWQRLRSPNWKSVTGMLPVAQFAKVHLHVALDPGVRLAADEDNDPTPSEIKQPGFGNSHWFESKSELLEKYGQFNLYFAPREKEGIGFSFIDAMEHGMIPVGFNRATFNEYVIDGINGFIVDRKKRYDLPPLEAIAENMLHYLTKGRAIYERRLASLPPFLFERASSPTCIPNWLGKRVPGLYRRQLRNRLRRSQAVVSAVRPARSANREPLVSIVTVVRPGACGLARTFQSVFGQIHNSIEYVVVDWKSGVGNRSLIDRHAGSIDIVLRQEGGTLGDGFANAAAAATGRFVLILDPGDEFADPTSVMDALHGAPEDAGIIYGHSYHVDREGRVSLRQARSLAASFQRLREKKPLPKDWTERLPTSRASFLARDAILDLLRGHSDCSDASLVLEALSGGAIPYHSNTVITRLANAGLPDAAFPEIRSAPI